MDIDTIMLNEIDQVEKDKYHIISLAWGGKKKKKKQISKQSKTKWIHRYSEQLAITRGKGAKG